ncbi:MAG: hypothetical protein C4317_09240 [Acidimicrobiia bacterium]
MSPKSRLDFDSALAVFTFGRSPPLSKKGVSLGLGPSRSSGAARLENHRGRPCERKVTPAAVRGCSEEGQSLRSKTLKN